METDNANPDAEVLSIDNVGVAESLPFNPAPIVSYRNPESVVEISSLLSGMYIDSPAEESDDETQPVLNPVGSEMGRGGVLKYQVCLNQSKHYVLRLIH